MLKVVGGVLGSEGGERFLKGLLKGGDRTGLKGTELLFELRPALFDGVEVGGVGRQVAKRGAGLLDEISHTVHFVSSQIVHDNQLAGFQLWTKDVFQVSQEDIAVRGRLNGHGGYPSGNTHCSQQSQCPPSASRNSLLNTRTMQRPAIAPSHFRRDAALVDEDELRRVDVPGFLLPELPLRFDSLAVLLGSVE